MQGLGPCLVENAIDSEPQKGKNPMIKTIKRKMNKLLKTHISLPIFPAIELNLLKYYIIALLFVGAVQMKVIDSSDPFQKDEALKQANELIPRNITASLIGTTGKGKLAAYQQLKEV